MALLPFKGEVAKGIRQRVKVLAKVRGELQPFSKGCENVSFIFSRANVGVVNTEGVSFCRTFKISDNFGRAVEHPCFIDFRKKLGQGFAPSFTFEKLR